MVTKGYYIVTEGYLKVSYYLLCKSDGSTVPGADVSWSYTSASHVLSHLWRVKVYFRVLLIKQG